MTTLSREQPMTLVTDPKPVTLKMSYEQFLAWSNEDTYAEWVPIDSLGNGEMIIQMPPKLIHQETIDFLSQLLGLFVRLFDLGKVVDECPVATIVGIGGHFSPHLF